MADLIFFRDKGIDFKCQVQINGANINNSFARLCLEFKDGSNYYFKGKLLEDGTCTFKVPKLKQVSENEGSALIEVVADSTYFNVFKSGVKIKNAVTVEFKMEETSFEENIDEQEQYKPIESADTNSKVSLKGIFINEDNVELNKEDKISKEGKYKKIEGSVPIFSEFMKSN